MNISMNIATSRRLIAAAAAAISISAAVPATAADLKIAVFDPQIVYAESNAAKRAGSELKSRQQQATVQIQNLEKPLLAKQKELATQQSLLAADKLKAAEDDLRKDYMNYRSQASKIGQDFERAQFDARKNIADAMRTVVSDIAKQKGYDLVLPKGVALYSSAAVTDISTEVLSGVNARLK